MRTETEPQRVLLAFFDVLGFSDRVANGEAPALYRTYVDLAKRLSLLRTTTYSQWLPRANPGDPLDLDSLLASLQSGQPIEWVPAARIRNSETDGLSTLHFSDTLIFWSVDDPLHHGEFIDVVIDFFCHALASGLPLRGALAAGDLIYDTDNSIIIGGALVEAAKAESAQAWCGVGLGPSFRGRKLLAPNDRVLSFAKHVKAGRDGDVLAMAVDWTWHWRNKNATTSLQSIADRFGDHPYWQTTLEFERLSVASRHDGSFPIFDLEVEF